MSKSATAAQLTSATDAALNYIIGINESGKLSEQSVYDIAATRSRLILSDWGAAEGVEVFTNDTNALTTAGEQAHAKIREVVSSIKPASKTTDETDLTTD